MKNSVPHHASHIASTQKPHVARGYHTGQHRTRWLTQKVQICNKDPNLSAGGKKSTKKGIFLIRLFCLDLEIYHRCCSWTNLWYWKGHILIPWESQMLRASELLVFNQLLVFKQELGWLRGRGFLSRSSHYYFIFWDTPMTSWWGEVLLPSTYPAPSPPPAWLAVLAWPTELPEPWGTEPNMRKWLRVPAPREAAARRGRGWGPAWWLFKEAKSLKFCFSSCQVCCFSTSQIPSLCSHITFFSFLCVHRVHNGTCVLGG